MGTCVCMVAENCHSEIFFFQVFLFLFFFLFFLYLFFFLSFLFFYFLCLSLFLLKKKYPKKRKFLNGSSRPPYMCLLLDLCTSLFFFLFFNYCKIYMYLNFTLNVSPYFNFKAYFETILFSPSHEATCSLYAAVSAASTPAMDI